MRHRSIVGQGVLILLLLGLCLSGYFMVRHILGLPFRPTNDALHRRGAPITLDFLIPGGKYLDEKVTIGEVVKLRLQEKKSPWDRTFQAISDVLPAGFRYLGDILLFLFWSLCYVSFFRIFTFMRYTRALRGGLFLGGITYFFMPDLSSGQGDDWIFLMVPFFIIVLRTYWTRRRRRIFKKESAHEF